MSAPRAVGHLPVISVLLVSYNTRALLDPCLAALRAALEQVPGGGEIVVVDNASRDDSAAHLASHHPDVTLIRSGQNLGFGRANNLGLEACHAPFVLLLNTDAFVEPEALARSLAHMQAHPRCGILGARLIGRDGRLQPSCRYFPSPLSGPVTRLGLQRLLPRVRQVDDMAWGHDEVRACDWVPGCYYLVRREVIEQVGLFDPRFFLYYEEVDHCREAKRAGWEVHYFPGTQVVHWGGESAGSDGPLTAGGRQLLSLQVESELLYFRKHHGLGGALACLVLETLAAGAVAARRVVRRRGATGRPSPWPRCRLYWAVSLRTRLGASPTR
jgi:GT2 family glycosyltransferase